ncbi:PDR/VanB family oxidoreductase [Pseudonocardia nematodicida]|uniref:PDR/VanB family oxidoreductase n=1 Tax=Pseudonocardia nematodicida TaxID=1206997 RepID=A0ABV1K4E8_9PSEU
MAAPAQAARRELRVRAMTHEADGVLSLRLTPLDPAATLPSWEPGAHVDLELPDGSTRQYSLCGDPAAPYWEIAVRHDEAGRGGSAHVHTVVRPGSVLRVGDPRSAFALADAPEHVFVAGGIGITPLLPMVARVAADGGRWRLHYVGRTRESTPFLDRAVLREPGARVHLTAETGRPALAGLLADLPDGAVVYVCGPAAMIDEARELLAGHPDRLRYELFRAPEADPDAESGSFLVRLARSGREVTVPAGGSLLDSLLDAGVDVLSDCREGICGSCETKVLAG